MRIDVITIFPEMVRQALSWSILGRAVDDGLVNAVVHDLRDYTDDKHRTVDEPPFGGGAGMVFKPEPIARALQDVLPDDGSARVIYLSPDGRRLDQSTANRLSMAEHLVLLCGHYRGIDERIRERYVNEEISIGDYVVTGGELPALVLIDSVIRLIPGVLGDAESALDDSFQNGLLDCGWYTRPRDFDGMTVPEVLLSGDHKRIADWRHEQSLQRTRERRPDLLDEETALAEDAKSGKTRRE